MTNHEKFLRERRRADALELELIQLRRSDAELHAKLGETRAQNERLKQACEPLVDFRRQLEVANDQIGALTSMVERLTFVADQTRAADITGNDSLGELPGSVLAIDPVRWAEWAAARKAGY